MTGLYQVIYYEHIDAKTGSQVKAFLLTFLILSGVFHQTVFAFEKNKVIQKTGFYEPSILFEAAAGSGIGHYEVGVDFQQDVALAFGGLYLSSTKYDVTGLEKDATMTGIGIRGIQLSSQEKDLVGVDLHLGLNKTKVGDYSRSGFEIAMTFYENMSKNSSFLLGVAFRPEFLSFDWSTDVATEFGFEAGVNYNINQKINLFSKYYYETLVDNDFDSNVIDDGVLVGFTFIF